MRTLVLLLAFLFNFNAIAVAPYGFKGQAQSSTQYSNVLQFPNSQVTKLAGINSLVETGNTNILINPSFEHSTFSTGWTESGTGTDTAESTVVIGGVRSFRTVTSSQTINLSQSSTLYAAQFADGVQGLASIRIKTNHTGAILVCSINAGVVSTTNCVTVVADNKWAFYKVPFVLGATSNGISIVGASGTGTTYFDDAFVGAQDLKQDISVVGPWAAYTPTFGGFGTPTNVSFFWRQVGDSIEVNGTFTTGTVAASLASINIPTQFTINSAKLTLANTTANPGPLVGDARQTANAGAAYSLVTATGTSTSAIYFGGPLAGSVILTPQNGSSSAVSSQTMAASFKVPVNQLNGATSIYSSSCGASCSDSYSAVVSSTGVVSAENADWINGNCVVSNTSTYTCTYNTPLFTVSPNCTITHKNSTAGVVIYSGMIDSSGTTSFIVNVYTNGARGAADFTVNCQKQGADFVATRTITGSFREVVTTQGTNLPSLCSAKISSTGVISDQRGGCFSSCTNATTPVCTFVTNYWAASETPNCWLADSIGGVTSLVSVSTTTVSGLINNVSGTAISGARSYFCHGGRQ